MVVEEVERHRDWWLNGHAVALARQRPQVPPVPPSRQHEESIQIGSQRTSNIIGRVVFAYFTPGILPKYIGTGRVFIWGLCDRIY